MLAASPLYNFDLHIYGPWTPGYLWAMLCFSIPDFATSCSAHAADGPCLCIHPCSRVMPLHPNLAVDCGSTVMFNILSKSCTP